MKTSLALVILLLGPAAAWGADLRGRAATPSVPTPAPATGWEGFYLGLHAGHVGTDASKADVSPLLNADGSPISAELRGSGAIGGAQAGYVLQNGAIVYGLEADMAKASLRGRQSVDGQLNAAPATARLEAKTEMVATLRGRIGYAFDRLLIYGTAGAAAAAQRSSFTVTSVDGGVTKTASGSSSGVYVGWALGLGADYAITRNVSGRLEYLYLNIADGLRGRTDPTGVHMIRTGVNYRF